MAFDITPYIDMKPSEVRKLIREGVIDFPTAGMCRGYAQANLVILPPEYAADFEEYAKKNPFPCPILEIIKGTPDTHDMGEGGNICTDIPRYRVYENGVFTKASASLLPPEVQTEDMPFLTPPRPDYVCGSFPYKSGCPPSLPFR